MAELLVFPATVCVTEDRLPSGVSSLATPLLRFVRINLNPFSGAPQGRRGADRKMRLFGKNAINSTYCLEYHLKPSRIQVKGKGCPFEGCSPYHFSRE